jgi:vacuolar protein sorting-associated protein 52
MLSGTRIHSLSVLANPSLQAALADGSLDLASYSSTVEQELQELESQCIQVYRRKESEIATLRSELVDCDAVLLALQEMLLGFQADLGGLSGEIRSIQEKSRTLAVQYGNRKQAEDGLSQFLSHIVIAPNLARSITSGPVNRVFQKAVREMNAIYQNVHDTQPQPWSANVPPSQTTAGREMQTHVYKLRCVAVTRVRYVVGSGKVECPRSVCTAFLPHTILKSCLFLYAGNTFWHKWPCYDDPKPMSV